MQREKAIEISRALDAIDSFEAFYDNLDHVFLETMEEDFAPFRYKFVALFEEELARRRAVLEAM